MSSPDKTTEAAVIARERTLANLAQTLAHLAVELSDREFLRMLWAMLDARRGPGNGPT